MVEVRRISPTPAEPNTPVGTVQVVLEQAGSGWLPGLHQPCATATDDETGQELEITMEIAGRALYCHAAGHVFIIADLRPVWDALLPLAQAAPTYEQARQARQLAQAEADAQAVPRAE